MAYVIRDGARSTAAAARDVGDPDLIVQPADASSFGTFGPGDLMRVSIFDPSDLVRAKGVLVIEGRDGPSLSVGGPFPGGATDFAVAIGDVVECCPLAADLAEVRADVSQLREDFEGYEGTPGPVGPPGEDGVQGPPGTAATVAIGTVTTGAPGSSASVVNAGTPSVAIFNITIPRGNQGDQGVQGVPGVQGPNTVSGLIAIPNDGSIKVEGGSGTSGDPLRLRAADKMWLAWMVADSAAGATGDASTSVPAPYACKLIRARMWARANPTGSILGQVKAAGSNLLGSSLSIAGGSVGPDVATIASPPSIAAGAAIVATWSALPSDARGVVIAIQILES